MLFSMVQRTDRAVDEKIGIDVGRKESSLEEVIVDEWGGFLQNNRQLSQSDIMGEKGFWSKILSTAFHGCKKFVWV